MFLFQKVSVDKDGDSAKNSTLSVDGEIDKDAAHNRNQGKSIHGLLLMAAAGLYLTIANSLVQYVYKKSRKDVSAYLLLFIRSGIIVSLNSVFMYLGRVKPFEDLKDLPFLCSIGLTGIGSILFVYLALEKMPVGDATVIQFTAPVFTASFSFLFLAKGCSIFDSICGTVSFLGVIVMTRPTILFGSTSMQHKRPQNHGPHRRKFVARGDTDGQYSVGVGFAILGAIFVSIFYVLNKLIGKKMDTTLTIFYPGLFGMLIPPIVMLILKEPFDLDTNWQVSLSVLLIGILSFIHLMFVAQALQLEDAGPASLVRNLDIVYAFILQYFLLKTPPHWMTIVGAVVVVIATSLIAVRRIVMSRGVQMVHQKQQAREESIELSRSHLNKSQ